MPEYISVAEAAKKWGVSDRTVRNYCSNGAINGAFLAGKQWLIPCEAERPTRKGAAKEKRDLLSVLRAEKKAGVSGGIYHKLQIDLTYNSNHIEGSRLTHDQTRCIFETATIGLDPDQEAASFRIDDLVETQNHFRCIDYVIETAGKQLTQAYVKRLHGMLKTGTTDASEDWFAVGEYKRYPNEVGGRSTAAPEEVAEEMEALLGWYRSLATVALDEIIEFHVRFERIHPFQDGNGRVGRLIALKECLKHGIAPFMITEELKLFYYRGLSQYSQEPGFLEGTVLTAQDQFRQIMDYFRIEGA